MNCNSETDSSEQILIHSKARDFFLFNCRLSVRRAGTAWLSWRSVGRLSSWISRWEYHRYKPSEAVPLTKVADPFQVGLLLDCENPAPT